MKLRTGTFFDQLLHFSVVFQMLNWGEYRYSSALFIDKKRSKVDAPAVTWTSYFSTVSVSVINKLRDVEHRSIICPYL